MSTDAHESWSAGQLYEPYVGRWSRRVAEEFLAWLQPSANWEWLDVGCGTGALSPATAGEGGSANGGAVYSAAVLIATVVISLVVRAVLGPVLERLSWIALEDVGSADRTDVVLTTPNRTSLAPAPVIEPVRPDP